MPSALFLVCLQANLATDDATFPERLMSRDPTAATRLGMMRGKMRAFNIRRNNFPTNET
jgi:hypothetical protein